MLKAIDRDGTNLDQTRGVMHRTEQVWDVRPGVSLCLRLSGWVLMKADSLSGQTALIQLLVLVGHHHHLLSLCLQEIKCGKLQLTDPHCNQFPSLN